MSPSVFPIRQAVRTDRWKYVRYPDFQGMEELYDLQSDPIEMKNLIRDASAEKTSDKMKAEMERLLRAEK